MYSSIQLLLFYLVAINLAAVFLIWSDARRACIGQCPVPERDLLITSFMGGWIGALITRAVMRHKRPELTFSLRFHGIPLLWALICLAMLPAARDSVVAFLAG